MVLLTNKVAYHNLMIENFVDEWVSKKKPDIYLHCYNGVTKCHKELFGQTQFMRDILTSAKSIQCQCGVLRISLPCSIQMANILVRFLYMGEIKLARFNEAKVFEIFDNLHKILGFEPDMWRDCEEGFSTDDDDSSGDSSDPSTYPALRESSDNESDPGTYEEQLAAKLAKKKFENVQVSANAAAAGSDKREAKKPGQKRDAVRAEGATAQKVAKKCPCSQCDKSFKFPSKLKTHFDAVHLKLKPHKCADCDLVFAQKDKLVSHVKSAHGDGFVCPQCSKPYSSKKCLDDHISEIHEGNRHNCDYCTSSFSQLRTLKAHLAKAHPEIERKK